MKVGNHGEFEQFWQQTQGKVRAYMLCACPNRSDADDLTQDCYVRALRHWDRYNGDGSRIAWLFAIARNTRVDWFRRQCRETRLCRQSSGGGIEEMRLESKRDDAEVIWRAVETLEREYQEVIHLRFAADLSYVEIAEMLRIPVGTVRSRLHRGLKAVRKQVKE